MSEVTKVKYTLDFNTVEKCDMFITALQNNDTLEYFVTPEKTGTSTIEFTLPRLQIRRLEKLRKRFEIKISIYSDKISTVSEYLY